MVLFKDFFSKKLVLKIKHQQTTKKHVPRRQRIKVGRTKLLIRLFNDSLLVKYRAIRLNFFEFLGKTSMHQYRLKRNEICRGCFTILFINHMSESFQDYTLIQVFEADFSQKVSLKC